MTEITILASGSRGDVQPYVALGKGLKEAGFAVCLLTSDSFAELAAGAGLAFCPTGPGIEEIVQGEEWQKVIGGGNFIAILRQMQRELGRHAKGLAKVMAELLPGSDLVVTGMAGLGGGFTMVEHFQIPLIEAHIYPFTPTGAFPSPLAPDLPLGGAFNRLSFHLMRQAFWQSTKAGDDATRKVLGLPKGPFWGPYRRLAQRTAPVLYGYSPSLLPRPDDWPENHVVTGFWTLSAPDGWAPPDDLAAFLASGNAPVYIGFGSMRDRNPEEAGQIALEALAQSGQRGVLAAGWGGIRANELPENAHLVAQVPHDWLFKQMAAVVHHGGAGTTAAGLRAGVPSVIIPFMGDQPFWGRRVHKAGAGPGPIPRKQLTAKRLAEAIGVAVSDPGMRRQASALGEQIRAEDGVRRAVAVIERFIGSGKLR